jgi:hypothetical protein
MKRIECYEFIWIQKDGTPIHVRQMTDEHLLNTIRLLRRWSKRRADGFNAENEGHIWEAADAEGLFWFDDDAFLEMHPTWPALQFERRVRGLVEKPIEREPLEEAKT